jgi:hypothetical protein
MPFPSAPQRPFVLTFVGTDGDGLGLGVGVGVGVGIGVGLVDDEELGTRTGSEDDEDGTMPLHDPKALRQPVPQYCDPLPQKYHSEQQLPKLEPPQVVTFPHWPLGEMIRMPDGSGGSTEELEGTTPELEDRTTAELDDGEGVGEGVGLGVGVGEGMSGGASPHRPYCG